MISEGRWIVTPSKRILTGAEAATICREYRISGTRVVFTNGCFDIIHPGHIHILRKSRSFGDVLMVGINSDDSVLRLKGPGRPILPLSARMEILLEMRSVDFAIPFGEDTPADLIRMIRPDILVKGGDYSLNDVVGAEFVTGIGGRVEIVPLLKGFSTTSILEALDPPYPVSLDRRDQLE